MKKSTLFLNRIVNKKEMKNLLSSAFVDFGKLKAAFLASKLKDLGFHYGTQAGISLSIEDLRIPPMKTILMKKALEQMDEADQESNKGNITEVERFQKVLNIWDTTSESLKERVLEYFKAKDPLNSIYMMAFSGARGNVSQVRQLVGMRGLMADPNGQIIDLPITTNFREGLTVSDYIISSYGARKGLVDTALKTADSGYLTRRLVDVAQDVITREYDCKTEDGIRIKNKASSSLLPLKDKLIGRVLTTSMLEQFSDSTIISKLKKNNLELTSELFLFFSSFPISEIVVRSPLTCRLGRAVCQKCYGWDLTLGNLVDLGTAVGVIAAQSIGEPGTQLTMRTFHTGGVFTSEPSRQIRAKFPGQITFSNLMDIKTTRTKYGDVVYKSENAGSLNVINFQNKNTTFMIPPKSLIFVENLEFVKKNDSLFELPISKTKTKVEKSLKNVYTHQSGEILVKNEKLNTFQNVFTKNKKNNSQLWVFSGKVFTIPLRSKINIKLLSWIDNSNTLAQSKLTTLIGGKVVNSSFNSEIDFIEVFKPSLYLKNLKLFIERQNYKPKNIAVYGNNHKVLYIDQKLQSKKKSPWFQIGKIINNQYKTKTGGIFFCNEEQYKTQNVRTIFYLPEFFNKITHSTVKTKIKIKTGDFIKKNQEYFKNKFSPFDGILERNNVNKLIEEFSIKPGYRLSFPKSYYDQALRFHQQIFFSGELIFNKFKLNRLSFLEVKKIKKKLYLVVRPLIRYESLKENRDLEYFSKFSFFPTEARIENSKVSFSPGKKIKTSKGLRWENRSFVIKIIPQTSHLKIKTEINKKDSCLVLSFSTHEFFSIKNKIPSEIKKENLLFVSLLENYQYIEPYTVFFVLHILASVKTFVYSIKEQYLDQQKRLLLTTNQDYQKLFFEDYNIKLQLNTFINIKNKLGKKLLSNQSGLIKKIKGTGVEIHLAQPYLFSYGGKVQKFPGYLIKKEESMGKLFYYKARTEDIVQGLPKIEALLEARKPNFPTTLVLQPGIVTQIWNTSSFIKVWILSLQSAKIDNEPVIYNLSRPCSLVVQLGDFVNVAQPLENKGINPNEILNIYFQYYKVFSGLGVGEAATRSYQIAQAVILNSVQTVYCSQGVNISDKHLEIIVRQMTKKVEIELPGGTNLFEKELVDFHQVLSMNECLSSTDQVFYKPVLLGITKASLKTESFLSKASFQNTTQVLTEAAIEGKTDWLRGLKENVITGSLIPAGTGFYSQIDFSYLLATVPPYKATKKNYFSKYEKIKNRLRFELTSNKK